MALRKKWHIATTIPSDIPLPVFITPPGAWSLAAWADAQSQTFLSAPVSGAPSIGAILPQGQAGDEITLCGSFSSSATFKTYSQTTAGNALFTDATIRRRIANRADVKISTSIPANAMVLLYALDSGKYSTPGVIGRAIAKWVADDTSTGSEYVIVGDTVSVHGRNLSNKNNWSSGYDISSPSDKCMIWLYTAGLTGQFVACTSINPYRAQFTMPAMWPTTTSTTSNTFAGSGDKSFTVASGLGYPDGNTLAVTVWNSTGFMKGTVKTYSGTSLVITMSELEDGTSGTFTSWNIEPTYDVDCYIHNGHGGVYGWSRKITFHLSNKPALGINYDKIEVLVDAPTGASDNAIFTNAKNTIGNGGPGTLRVRDGTYKLSTRLLASLGFGKACLIAPQNAGMTTITTTSDFVPTSGELISSNALSELRDLIIDTSSFTSGNVTNATNATPIQITTSAAHGLSDGDGVRITGVGGNTAANGGWPVTVVNTTNFTLNTSTGNGAYTSGGTWAYETTVRVPRLVNCTISVRAPATIDFPTTSSCFMTGNSITAPYADALNNTSIYIDNNDFYGTDLADQLVHTGGSKNVTFTNNTGQHLNPAGTNAEKGHGRFFVAECNIYGSQRNVYIAGNTTPTAFTNPESFGDGELFLSDGALCSSSSLATAATSTSVTITDVPSSTWANTRHAVITGGLGEGQSRLITNADAGTKVLTVDPPWDLVPDTTSRINICGFWSDVVIYNNQVTGGYASSTDVEQGDSQGFNLFTGANNFIADGNTFTNMFYGYSEWAISTVASLTQGMCPLFFNLVQNNTFSHCHSGIRTVVDSPLDSETAAMLGNVRRNNTWTSLVRNGWYFLDIAADVDLEVMQGCTLTGMQYGLKSVNVENVPIQIVDSTFTGSGGGGSSKVNITVTDVGSTSYSSF